jgi:hypothetical protein
VKVEAIEVRVAPAETVAGGFGRWSRYSSVMTSAARRS